MHPATAVRAALHNDVGQPHVGVFAMRLITFQRLKRLSPWSKLGDDYRGSLWPLAREHACVMHDFVWRLQNTHTP